MNLTILWLRNTLRVHDNPVLTDALHHRGDASVVPIFTFDVESLHDHNGVNRVRFLYETLADLKVSFTRRFGCPLMILNGTTRSIFERILGRPDFKITGVTTGCSNKPMDLLAERAVRTLLDKHGAELRIVAKANTLTDVEKIVTQPGFKNPKSMKDVEKIFARQFERSDTGNFLVDEPLEVPDASLSMPENFASALEDFVFDLQGGLSEVRSRSKGYFTGGESEALLRLERKVTLNGVGVRNFSKPRSISTNDSSNPHEPDTTGLSPYLAFGCLSPRTVWWACEACYRKGEHTKPPVSLHGQLLFREMFYILSHSVENWDSDTDNVMCKKITWGDLDKTLMEKWKKGQTGFPYIDAMMRQLGTTGWMHHLGRHAVSCFLTRGQLWQHWKHGRDVFDEQLVDGDWALNNGNWLWLAGVAPFSMPYFRLYNPCPNAKSSLNVECKTADFVRFWVPELKDFPSKYIYEPHLAPLSVQEAAGCIVGQDYPLPIVDRKAAAKENLARFKGSLAELRQNT